MAETAYSSGFGPLAGHLQQLELLHPAAPSSKPSKTKPSWLVTTHPPGGVQSVSPGGRQQHVDLRGPAASAAPASTLAGAGQQGREPPYSGWQPNSSSCEGDPWGPSLRIDGDLRAEQPQQHHLKQAVSQEQASAPQQASFFSTHYEPSPWTLQASDPTKAEQLSSFCASLMAQLAQQQVSRDGLDACGCPDVPALATSGNAASAWADQQEAQQQAQPSWMDRPGQLHPADLATAGQVPPCTAPFKDSLPQMQLDADGFPDLLFSVSTDDKTMTAAGAEHEGLAAQLLGLLQQSGHVREEDLAPLLSGYEPRPSLMDLTLTQPRYAPVSLSDHNPGSPWHMGQGQQQQQQQQQQQEEVTSGLDAVAASLAADRGMDTLRRSSVQTSGRLPPAYTSHHQQLQPVALGDRQAAGEDKEAQGSATGPAARAWEDALAACGLVGTWDSGQLQQLRHVLGTMCSSLEDESAGHDPRTSAATTTAASAAGHSGSSISFQSFQRDVEHQLQLLEENGMGWEGLAPGMPLGGLATTRLVYPQRAGGISGSLGTAAMAQFGNSSSSSSSGMGPGPWLPRQLGKQTTQYAAGGPGPLQDGPGVAAAAVTGLQANWGAAAGGTAAALQANQLSGLSGLLSQGQLPSSASCGWSVLAGDTSDPTAVTAGDNGWPATWPAASMPPGGQWPVAASPAAAASGVEAAEALPHAPATAIQQQQQHQQEDKGKDNSVWLLQQLQQVGTPADAASAWALQDGVQLGMSGGASTAVGLTGHWQGQLTEQLLPGLQASGAAGMAAAASYTLPPQQQQGAVPFAPVNTGGTLPSSLPAQPPSAGMEGGVLTAAPTAAAPAAPAADASPERWWRGAAVSPPKAVALFHFWVLQLAAVSQALTRDRTLPYAVLVSLALWPIAARACCFQRQHRKTLTGAGMLLKTDPRNPQQQPSQQFGYMLEDQDRIAYTRGVWALRLLVAGLWKALEGVVPEQVVLYLPLTEPTVLALIQLTWAAFSPGQACPAWAPDWRLEEDLAGRGDLTYYMPELVTQQSDLQQVVIQDTDLAAWLLKHYQDLASMPISNDNPLPMYSFLRVDTQQQQLVVDVKELLLRVGGWSLGARNLARGWPQAQG